MEGGPLYLVLSGLKCGVLVSMILHLDNSLSHVQFPLSEEMFANDHVQLLGTFS